MYRQERVTRRYNPGQSVSLTVSVKAVNDIRQDGQ